MADETMTDTTVFTARRVRTMEPSLPVAEAVAVRDGLIVEVGSLETMQPWLDRVPHHIDDTFREHVIFPGFIDPHLHPSMAAILLNMHFATVVAWALPWDDIGAVRNRTEFLNRITDLDGSLPTGEPLFVFGHHPIWHGDIDRHQLNAISTDRPIIVWHRGYHTIVVNDVTTRWMDLDLGAAERHPQIDLEEGRFFETGLSVALRQMRGYLLETERFRSGLRRVRRVVHQGGHTTIGEAALGFYGLEDEWAHLRAVMDQPETPFRIQLLPHVFGPEGGPEADRDFVERAVRFRERNTRRLRFSDHVKLFADGGFFAEMLMLKPPGHFGGRHGEWITPPERFQEIARALWNARLNIHVHCSGDLGVELALSTLEQLQWERPRFDHRFTFEHFGISSSQQVARIARNGGAASVNVYYVYELARAFAEKAVGYERASQFSRLGSLERSGVPFAVHSDFPMAPAKPLNNAWIAANRVTESGDVMGPDERTTLDAAMRAITTSAAYVLGLEDEVGSLRWGKKADFTILGDDPYDVGVEGLRDIPVWGTVFEGQLFPLVAS